MCIPQRPQTDGYDNVLRVTAHFYPTPPLTLIPRGHPYNYALGSSIIDEVRRRIIKVYRDHNLPRCPRYGLYFSGSKAMVEDKENDKIMLLVIELKRQDIGKWWKIDGEVRQILQEWSLSGDAGVCVRYYVFNQHATVEQTIHVEPFEEDDTPDPAPPPEVSYATAAPPGAGSAYISAQRMILLSMPQIHGDNSASIWSPQRPQLPPLSPTRAADAGTRLPDLPTSSPQGTRGHSLGLH